ncbi:hypothetical protein [Ferrovum sp.]|uniref:hypothetical protein n=1 Tax=Ferrovum sp. TaxID=2609467 RepID=UPI0026087E95|nr:hypothetical protein [Ferrovum sp.]
MTRLVSRNGSPCPSGRLNFAQNLALFVPSLIFFPAVLLVFAMFLTSLLLAAVCIIMVAMVKFSRFVINTSNGVII